MKNYILADCRRVLTTRAHIIEIAVFGVWITVLAFWKSMTATGNWNSLTYMDAISLPMSMMAMFLGMFVLIGVFSEDFKAKTMQVAIGRGIRRDQVVAVKLIDVTLVMLIDLAVFLVLTVGLSFVTGAPLAGQQLARHLIDFLVQWLECVGYTALVLTLLFRLQNMLVPILIYILFSSRAVYSILRALTFWGPEWAQQLHLESLTLDACLDTLRTHLVLGRLNPGALIGIGVYLGLGYLAAVLVFRREELEF